MPYFQLVLIKNTKSMHSIQLLFGYLFMFNFLFFIFDFLLSSLFSTLFSSFSTLYSSSLFSTFYSFSSSTFFSSLFSKIKWDKIYFSLNLIQCQKSLMSTCMILILTMNFTNKYVHGNYMLSFLLWLEYNKSLTLLRL